MSLAAYNFKKVNEQYCSKRGKLKDRFITWGKCGNDAKPDTKKCWDKMMNLMSNVMQAESKNRVPVICWWVERPIRRPNPLWPNPLWPNPLWPDHYSTYYEWIACNDRVLSKADVCSEETRQGFKTHIHKSTVDSMNLICSKYDNDPTKCKPYMDKAVRTKNKGRLHKAPLLYVFDVFEQIDSGKDKWVQ